MVDTHFYIPPIGDLYWINRQNVLMAIDRAVRQHKIEYAQLYSFATSEGEPEWRVAPKKKINIRQGRSRSEDPSGDESGPTKEALL